MAVAPLVRDYYGVLRDEDPLYPYFRESPATVKYGISETLRGYDAVAEGLREQTRTTTDWTVESRNLTAGTRDGLAESAGDGPVQWTDDGPEQSVGDGPEQSADDGPEQSAGGATGNGGGDGGAACGWFADDVFMAWTDTDRRTSYEFETRWTGTVVDGEFAAVHVSTAEAL